MLAALGFIALLFALVAVIDRILDKNKKKLIGNEINRRLLAYSSQTLPLPDNKATVLAQPFSFESFKISILMSLISLGFLIYIQYFTLGYQFSEIFKNVPDYLSNKFVIFIIYMIIANCLIDFLSFTQTLVIIKLIN